MNWIYPVPDPGIPPSLWPESLILAATILGEAEGETLAGKEAVAAVIMNRVADEARRWPLSVEGVCLQARQFSCWGDERRLKVMRFPAANTTREAWHDSFVAAVYAIEGATHDPVSGANHYCTVETNPNWATGLEPVAVIGRHKFYRR